MIAHTIDLYVLYKFEFAHEIGLLKGINAVNPTCRKKKQQLSLIDWTENRL